MATMADKRYYPIGIQSFSEMRREGFLYVDKTAYIHQLAHSKLKFVFLSRPRRFGKSLLTSTLQCYFEGRRELFEGLAIERMETEWQAFPVLHFDMSQGKGLDKEALERSLIDQLEENEQRQGVEPKGGTDINLRLKNLILNTHAKMGLQVVLLIDEYDSPLLDVVHEEENLPRLRQVMSNFFSPLKKCSDLLRFCFITGITKFSQLSIFSALNSIKNISMLPEYAAICGFTLEELTAQMSTDIDLLAARTGDTRAATLDRLVDYYDGYHFTWPSPDVFNPYSLMNAFNDGMVQAYWFSTGTPTYLIEVLRKNGVQPSMIGRRTAVSEDFDAPTESLLGTTPLLYQSGYLTIKDYDADAGLYTLDIPNREIRHGLMRSLLPHYIGLPPEAGSTTLANMYKALRHDDMDGALRELQTYIGTIPYTNATVNEGHYQQMLYVVFSLMGIYTDVEVHTATGRVDIVMRTMSRLYIIELKMNQSAEAAMAQINLRDYAARFAQCGLPRVKVGINFDQARRNITDWAIAPVQD